MFLRPSSSSVGFASCFTRDAARGSDGLDLQARPPRARAGPTTCVSRESRRERPATTYPAARVRNDRPDIPPKPSLEFAEEVAKIPAISAAPPRAGRPVPVPHTPAARSSPNISVGLHPVLAGRHEITRRLLSFDEQE